MFDFKINYYTHYDNDRVMLHFRCGCQCWLNDIVYELCPDHEAHCPTCALLVLPLADGGWYCEECNRLVGDHEVGFKARE